MALFAVQSGKVGAVAHTIADDTDPRHTRTTLSRTRDEMLRGAGSRYAQASPAEALADLPADPVVFIGKPCDVASVAKAQVVRADLAQAVPLTIAIFCAGAPNLTDADWVYGGDATSIRQTLMAGRQGQMPSWQSRLTEAEIRAMALYVENLAGAGP